MDNEPQEDIYDSDRLMDRYDFSESEITGDGEELEEELIEEDESI